MRTLNRKRATTATEWHPEGALSILAFGKDTVRHRAGGSPLAEASACRPHSLRERAPLH